MYTITLNDGTKLEGLTFEHNLFFSSSVLKPDMFRGKLNPVTISSDTEDETGITGTHQHMELCYVKLMNGKYALALADISDERWDFEKLRADVDFALLLGGASF